MNKLIIFALVVVYIGYLAEANGNDCRAKLEEGIAGVDVPAELKNAVENIVHDDRESGSVRLPAYFNWYFDVTKYLDGQDVEDKKTMIEAAASFRKAANHMLRSIDCDKSALYQLIDVDNAQYKILVEPMSQIDNFNSYYELSNRIFYSDFNAKNWA